VFYLGKKSKKRKKRKKKKKKKIRKSAKFGSKRTYESKSTPGNTSRSSPQREMEEKKDEELKIKNAKKIELF
jgi:hypothetical protein